jgi:uncharacterized protein (DUF427 family)
VPKAVWNEIVIAESDDTIVVENNHYFPPESVKEEFLRPSETSSVCPWKGTASYYHVEVGSSINSDAAWYYPDPKEAAMNIKGYVAFWKGVEIRD